MKKERKRDLVTQLKAEIAERDRREDKAFEGPLRPPISLLCKLGSIAVHADELLSPCGHPFDKAVLLQLLQDSEVKSWISNMKAFMPVKR